LGKYIGAFLGWVLELLRKPFGTVHHVPGTVTLPIIVYLPGGVAKKLFPTSLNLKLCHLDGAV
jgi:hypothetical protein